MTIKGMNQKKAAEIIAFIAGVFCGSTEGRYPMTQQEAWITIKAWRAEGVELPKGLDATNLSSVWNQLYDGIDRDGLVDIVSNYEEV